MPNIQIACSDEAIEALFKEVMLLFKEEPEEKQAVTLKRVLEAAKTKTESFAIREAGVDAEGLYASMRNIVSQFVTASKAKDEVVKNFEERLHTVKVEAEKTITTLNDKIDNLNDSLKTANKKAEEAFKQSEDSKNELTAANELKNKAEELSNARLETITHLSGEIEKMKEKAEAYDDLEARYGTACDDIQTLKNDLVIAEKDKELAIRDTKQEIVDKYDGLLKEERDKNEKSIKSYNGKIEELNKTLESVKEENAKKYGDLETLHAKACNEILELKSKLALAEKDRQLAISDAVRNAEETLRNAYEEKIERLREENDERLKDALLGKEKKTKAGGSGKGI